MRQLMLGLSSILCFLTATAFISPPPLQNFNTNTEPAVYKLMEVTYLWDLLKENYGPNRDSDATWLDVGFRSKYAMAKKYASIEMLEAVFETPVFIRGPHQGDMDFNSTTSFGYYNPAFIAKLRTSIENALKNPVFKKAAKQVYQSHLKGMALTYHDAYLYLHKNDAYLDKLQTEYLSLLAQPEGTTNGSLQEEFRNYADGMTSDIAEKEAAKKRNSNVDWYESVTAPAFWLRRSIDQSDKEIFDLLDMVIKEMN